MKLDIGTGEALDPSWTAVDAYDTRAPLRAPMWSLPIPAASVDAIRCSHALEHIPSEKVARTLEEWRRVLVPGGTLWVMVPTLDYVCRYWLEHRDDWGMKLIFGLQTGPGQEHKGGFTLSSLVSVLKRSGFRDVGVYRTWSHNQDCLVGEAVK